MNFLKNYTHLLFDLDNTLLDFDYSAKQAFKELFQAIYSDELYKSYKAINATYWRYFEREKINAKELHLGRFEAFFSANKLNLDAKRVADEYLEQLLKHSIWINGAEAALQKYAKTHEVALVTNGLSSVQHLRIEKHQLKNYFSQIFISEELESSKPSAAFFEYVHHRIGKPQKNKVLVIGDNPKSDIKGGNNFGYHTCFFDYENKYKCSTATHAIKSWEENA